MGTLRSTRVIAVGCQSGCQAIIVLSWVPSRGSKASTPVTHPVENPSVASYGSEVARPGLPPCPQAKPADLKRVDLVAQPGGSRGRFGRRRLRCRPGRQPKTAGHSGSPKIQPDGLGHAKNRFPPLRLRCFSGRGQP
jgi:hypothetical protein